MEKLRGINMVFLPLSIKRVARLAFLSAVILTLAPFNSSAQNFADFNPDSESIDGTIPDDVIEELLAQEDRATIALDIKEDLPNSADESTYTLGVNDVIQINVMRHPEVSGEFRINSEGKIQYEFVGDIVIQGMVKHEVKELLVEKLSKYIISPELTVKIIGYNSKVVYVVGEVGRPGKIFMQGNTITVREALIQAALPLLSAKTTKSRLITPSEQSKPVQRPVNVHKLLFEGDLRENLVMNPGDTLYIPPTVMAKAMRVIQPIQAPLGAARGTATSVMTGF
ncbi:MAG: polysaccharide export protein [Candidatus Omnitrophica bacterium]|nr:polysaccharide export protein [Candidatus Omnitrophota bacterium]MBU1995925.1 polysaccharide export protein [Candidatus Omnitrophota bacterium]